MKCDEEPCKNLGICTEDFVKGESTCDCELTSYFGESCNEGSRFFFWVFFFFNVGGF